MAANPNHRKKLNKLLRASKVITLAELASQRSTRDERSSELADRPHDCC